MSISRSLVVALLLLLVDHCAAMDFKGQLHCERTFQLLVLLFGSIGFIVGYVQQDFRSTFLCLAAGGALSAVICLPDWPWWNLYPPKWLPYEEADEEPEPEVDANSKPEKEKKKKKKASKAE
uniref:Signal peptidase complex subunit 1 n=1 Tax=Coccolithus braarudii TaxID=221442 RepID=A0A7S0LJP8_9EUKA|mmetsp:Transcript_41919/g.89481  ORF Transcript_41919/g.89481 Transcript_41919/m.89481 type:complete len:122 (+) Transcript_41919:31-396(+)